MKKFLHVLVFLISFGLVYSAPNEAYNKQEGLNCIVRWNKKNTNFDKQKPTLIFATSLMHCSSCCVAAANSIALASKNYPLNMLLLIENEEEEDNPKSKAKGYYQLEDTKNELKTIFKITLQNPELIIISQSGEIIYSNTDIQHSTDEFIKQMSSILSKTNAGNVRSLKVKINETETDKFKNIVNPTLNKVGTEFCFIEPAKNKIYTYGLKSGKVVSVLDIDDSLGFYYYNNPVIKTRQQTDSMAWYSFKNGVYPVAPGLDGIISWQNDTLSLLCNGFVSYLYKCKMQENPDAQVDSIIWAKEPIMYKIYKGKWLPPSLLQKRDYTATKIENFLPNRYEIGNYFARNYFGKLITDCSIVPKYIKNPDSVYLMSLYDPQTGESEKIIPIKSLSDKATQFNPNSGIRWFINQTNGDIFIINGKEKYFWRYNFLKNKDGMPTKLTPGGRLESLFSGDSMVRVLNMNASGDMLYVTLLNETQKWGEIIIQSYSNKTGLLVTEKNLETDKKDEIMISKILNVSADEIVLLNKYKQKRWWLESIKLSDLNK